MFAKFLKNKYGAEVISLANPIKELCARLLGVTLEQLNDMKNSDTKVASVSNGNHFKATWVEVIMSEVSGIPEKNVSDWVNSVLSDEGYTVRMMLQTIGTELIRQHDKEWHIRRMLEAIQKSTAGIVVVDDIRFPNEREAFEKAGGSVYFVLRPDLTILVSNHSSENSIHWYDFDSTMVILNMYDRDFMEREFDKVVTHPMSKGGSPIIARFHDPCDDVCGFGRVADVIEHPLYCHYMKTLVIPSLMKHNGCLIVNTDSVSVLKWLKEYIPHVISNQICQYSTRLETIAYWNPFLVENVKEWL